MLIYNWPAVFTGRSAGAQLRGGGAAGGIESHFDQVYIFPWWTDSGLAAPREPQTSGQGGSNNNVSSTIATTK